VQWKAKRYKSGSTCFFHLAESWKSLRPIVICKRLQKLVTFIFFMPFFGIAPVCYRGYFVKFKTHKKKFEKNA
jgi:hypothetical protein